MSTSDISAANITATKRLSIPVIPSISGFPGLKDGSVVLERSSGLIYICCGSNWKLVGDAAGSNTNIVDSVRSGISLVQKGIGPNIQLKPITAGNGISVYDGADGTIKILNTLPSESYVAGEGIEIINGRITNISPGSDVNIVSRGNGEKLLEMRTPMNFAIKSVKAGEFIELTSNQDELIVSATIPRYSAGDGIYIDRNGIIENTKPHRDYRIDSVENPETPKTVSILHDQTNDSTTFKRFSIENGELRETEPGVINIVIPVPVIPEPVVYKPGNGITINNNVVSASDLFITGLMSDNTINITGDHSRPVIRGNYVAGRGIQITNNVISIAETSDTTKDIATSSNGFELKTDNVEKYNIGAGIDSIGISIGLGHTDGISSIFDELLERITVLERNSVCGSVQHQTVERADTPAGEHDENIAPKKCVMLGSECTEFRFKRRIQPDVLFCKGFHVDGGMNSKITFDISPVLNKLILFNHGKSEIWIVVEPSAKCWGGMTSKQNILKNVMGMVNNHIAGLNASSQPNAKFVTGIVFKPPKGFCLSEQKSREILALKNVVSQIQKVCLCALDIRTNEQLFGLVNNPTSLTKLAQTNLYKAMDGVRYLLINGQPTKKGIESMLMSTYGYFDGGYKNIVGILADSGYDQYQHLIRKIILKTKHIGVLQEQIQFNSSSDSQQTDQPCQPNNSHNLTTTETYNGVMTILDDSTTVVESMHCFPFYDMVAFNNQSNDLLNDQQTTAKEVKRVLCFESSKHIHEKISYACENHFCGTSIRIKSRDERDMLYEMF